MHWENEFESIVQNMGLDIKEEDVALQMGELNRAVMGMNEAATFMGKLLSESFLDEECLSELEPEVVDAIRASISLTDYIAAQLLGCPCSDCSPCECEDDEEFECESCTSIYLMDDDEE